MKTILNRYELHTEKLYFLKLIATQFQVNVFLYVKTVLSHDFLKNEPFFLSQTINS